jgi:NAD(P)-dependent dehydrogenase (short-subunit alcohol dehydrogenase family)
LQFKWRLSKLAEEPVIRSTAADQEEPVPLTNTAVLITGVSRREGLGFATAKLLAGMGMQVIVTARDVAKAQTLARELSEAGATATGLPLDVTSDQSAKACAAAIEERFGRLGVLINNASGEFDMATPSRGVPLADVQAALDVTLFGALRLIQATEALLLKSEHPRIVNVSSEAASFTSLAGMATRGTALLAYAVAKSSLNAMTVKLAAAYAGTPIMINAVCPGWIATYPGTAEMGARPVEAGAASVAWAATLPDDGPRGGFFRDGQPLAW